MAEQQVPLNSQLWGMIVTLAKTKFHPYPSQASAHWVHEQYTNRGGQFADSVKKQSTPDRKARLEKEHKDREEAKKK